jgi:hypothetical protein
MIVLTTSKGDTMAHIEIIRAGAVKIGDKITMVDDESLTTNDEVNENYDAYDQDWSEVLETGGHADIGWIKINHPYEGETKINGDWDQLVWVLRP